MKNVLINTPQKKHKKKHARNHIEKFNIPTAMFTGYYSICWIVLHETLIFMSFKICIFIEMVRLFECKYFKIISHYCYHMNSSFALSYYKCMTHLYFINRILEPISGDVINIVMLSMWQYATNTNKLNHNKTRWKNIKN
jgi:hypothetical protein